MVYELSFNKVSNKKVSGHWDVRVNLSCKIHSGKAQKAHLSPELWEINWWGELQEFWRVVWSLFSISDKLQGICYTEATTFLTNGVIQSPSSRCQVRDLITKGKASVVTVRTSSLIPISQTRSETKGRSSKVLIYINGKTVGLVNWSLNWITKKESHAPESVPSSHIQSLK